MKIRVGVIFGGMSVEHEVSVISGLQVYHSLIGEKYEPVPVYIAKDGNWYTGKDLVKIEEYTNIQALLKKVKKVFLYTNENEVHQLIAKKKFTNGMATIEKIDVAFPVTHGTFGEDGSLQGLLELHRIPYVGSDVLSSAIGMDKVMMKSILKTAGLPIVDYIYLYGHDWINDQGGSLIQIEENLGYPIIVKPSNLGSSVGISVATNKEELIDALKNAFSYSYKVIIEKVVQNLKEVNCSVLGDIEGVEVSICEEVLKTNNILSYQDKYMNSASKGMSGTSRIIPADISTSMTNEVQNLAKQVFSVLQCNGVSRVDFLVDQSDGHVFINEINTIPGSLAFYLWEPIGKSFHQLTNDLIQLALKKKRISNQLTFTYDTNLLSIKGIGGVKKSGNPIN